MHAVAAYYSSIDSQSDERVSCGGGELKELKLRNGGEFSIPTVIFTA